jgi:predicted nucleic-acid-binding protein
MQHYKSLGTREKAINIILDNLEEDDEIIEEAKKIFEEKNKESKTEKLIVKKEEENQELKRQYQERVQSINNELQQTGWKKEKIERVSNLLSNQNLNTRLTEAFKNPKAIVQLADFLDMYNEKTKEFDLTSYKNQTLSTVTKTLKERLEKESFSSASLNTKHRNTDPNKDFEDDLVPVI